MGLSEEEVGPVVGFVLLSASGCSFTHSWVVSLSEIKEIRLGQKTLVFQKNPLPEYEPFSFSLIYDDRTLDIVSKDKAEFNTWVVGLKSLTMDGQEARPQAVPELTRTPTETEKLSISFKGSQTIVSKREGKRYSYLRFYYL